MVVVPPSGNPAKIPVTGWVVLFCTMVNTVPWAGTYPLLKVPVRLAPPRTGATTVLEETRRSLDETEAISILREVAALNEMVLLVNVPTLGTLTITVAPPTVVEVGVNPPGASVRIGEAPIDCKSFTAPVPPSVPPVREAVAFA